VGLSLTGLASGLDSDTIIQKLMEIERQPETRMQLQQKRAQARQDALRDVMTRLGNLQSAARDLRSTSLWAPVQTVDSSDSAKIGAQVVSGAGVGGYQVSVQQLARSEQRTYAYTASGSASQITIGSAAIDIAVGASLADVVATVNARADSPVYASAVNGQLVLSGKTTGSASGFGATGATLVEDGAKAKLGQDAIVIVDGTTVTSSSNVARDAIPGVELTLKSVTASPVTISVGAPAPNSDAIKSTVKAFVDQYNSTIDFIRSKLAEKQVTDPKTDADYLKGVLFGDTGLSGLLSQMRIALTSAVPGNPSTLDQLSEIGVSTGAASGTATFSTDAVAGKLTIDDAKLTAAIAGDPTSVRTLLGGNGSTSGIAQLVEGLLTPQIGAGGLIPGRISSAQSEAKDLADRMSALDERLSLHEQQLKSQFAALESVLSKSQAQGQWLAGQLAALPQQH
jgi:flagellar hook-associated protein 2